MKIIADLHIHSKYSRATSPKMEPLTLDLWARKKGINLMATGDITHPQYLKELKEKLEEDGSGFLSLKKKYKNTFGEDDLKIEKRAETKFVLSGEIASIYKQAGKCRRIHNLVLVPDFDSVEKLNKELVARGCNLKSDGRPIVGLSSKELAKICFEINEKIIFIPAHIWTPWFAMFGSKSGFDTIEECFEELAPKIFVIETGLSSDPQMNWRVSQLDRITFVSNSDAHSPMMIGREANVFDFENFTYEELYQTLKKQDKNKFKYTIEFYPQEGKYHWNGHRDCRVVMSPQESFKNKNLCPVCKKPLVLGVDHQVESLANRKLGFVPSNKIPFKSIIPLNEIISEILGVGKNSKKVIRLYEEMIKNGKNEFAVLLDLSQKELVKISNDLIAQAIIRMRAGQVIKYPGYDGEYGKIKVFDDKELEIQKKKQKKLL